jgi:hypothetical protein
MNEIKTIEEIADESNRFLEKYQTSVKEIKQGNSGFREIRVLEAESEILGIKINTCADLQKEDPDKKNASNYKRQITRLSSQKKVVDEKISSIDVFLEQDKNRLLELQRSLPKFAVIKNKEIAEYIKAQTTQRVGAIVDYVAQAYESYISMPESNSEDVFCAQNIERAKLLGVVRKHIEKELYSFGANDFHKQIIPERYLKVVEEKLNNHYDLLHRLEKNGEGEFAKEYSNIMPREGRQDNASYDLFMQDQICIMKEIVEEKLYSLREEFKEQIRNGRSRDEWDTKSERKYDETTAFFNLVLKVDSFSEIPEFSLAEAYLKVSRK